MAPLLALLLAPLPLVASRSLDGEYLVRLADASPATHDAMLRDLAPLAPASVFRIHDVRIALFRDVNASGLRLLRASRAVRYAEPNAEVHAHAEQRNPPSWGLPRVGQRHLPLHDVYRYVDSAGAGVDAYILDTGIMLSHHDFEGRASWGFTAASHAHEGEVDGNGHGTHVAGTMGGKEYGVAKRASLIAVKVLGNSGSGSTADVVSGVEYAVQQRERTGRRSVINLSLGGGPQPALDDAIDAAAAAGVHNAISAGNDNRADACTKSPASAPRAYTVAAADRADDPASFSNIGRCVDIWAPGVDILAPYIGGNSAVRSLSGTSMSAPHVAGVMALVLGERGDMPAADLAAAVSALATDGVIRFPSPTPQHVNPPRANHSHHHPPRRDQCAVDSDCRGSNKCCPGGHDFGSWCGAGGAQNCCGPFSCRGSNGDSCCSVGGVVSHCAERVSSCCAGGSCRTWDICCNPGESGAAHCCQEGEICLAGGGCFNPLFEVTPNRNLFSDPPARGAK